MPKSNETTTKFKVDISELKAGIQEASRQIRLANAEFKAASSGMDDWADSAEGVAAKIKQLEKVLSAENTKLESLKKQLELTEKEYGSNSKAADELRIAIANQQASINKTEKELKKYKSGLEKVDDETEDVEKSTKELSGGFTVLKGAMASLLADGVKNIISSFTNLASSTREYRKEMAKLETAFEDNGFSVETAKNTYEDFYEILGDEGQSVEAANHLAKLTDNEKDLQKWTNVCAGVYGTFGASLPLEGLTEAANETAKVAKVTGSLADALNWTTLSTDEWNAVLKDNPKAMKAFNAGVSEGMNQEDAFNEALANCSTEQERQTLILGTLNEMYGDAAAKYKENSKEVMKANEAQSKLNDRYAELGAKAEPVITAVKLAFAGLLEKVVELASNVDIYAFIEKVKEGFSACFEKIKAFKDGIIDLLPVIAGLGTALAGLALAGLIQNINKVGVALKAWAMSTKIVTAAQWLLNAAMSANPISLIVIAIAGLVAAFVVLWKKSEKFRNFWINLWEGIKKVVQPVIEALVGWFSSIWEKIQEIVEFIKPYIDAAINEIVSMFEGAWGAIKAVWDLVKPYFEMVWNNIKAIFSVVKAVLGGFFKVAWEAIKGVWSMAVPYFKLIWNNIKAVFSVVAKVLGAYFKAAWDIIKAIWSVVVSFFKTIWNNIKLIFSVVKDVLSGNFGDAWESIKKIFSNFGAFFKTCWDSVKKVFSSVGTFFKTSFSAAWEGVKKVFSNFTTFFSDIWEAIKKTFSNVGTAIGDAITNTVKTAVNGVLSMAVGIINGFIGAINGAIGIINKIPGVKIKKLSKLEVPEMYEGGIAKKGRQYLLEGRGDEAVVPLHNNKKWISKTAKDLKGQLAAEGVISGKYGASGGNVTNNYNFTQNNTSPKALSRLEIYRQTKNQLAFAKGV